MVKSKYGNSKAAPQLRAKPGPKTGSWHAGMFKSNDPRRWTGGRPKSVHRTVEEIAQESVEDAVAFMVALMNDRNANARDRLAAAKEVLDRGCGKSVDRQVVASMKTNIDIDDAINLTDAELMAIANGAVIRVDPLQEVRTEVIIDRQLIDLKDESNNSYSPESGTDQ